MRVCNYHWHASSTLALCISHGGCCCSAFIFFTLWPACSPLVALAKSQWPLKQDMMAVKRRLRKAVANALGKLPADEILSQSDAVVRQLRDHPVFASSRAIFLYLSMDGGELNTNMLVHTCFRSKKCVYVPKVAGGR